MKKPQNHSSYRSLQLISRCISIVLFLLTTACGGASDASSPQEVEDVTPALSPKSEVTVPTSPTSEAEKSPTSKAEHTPVTANEGVQVSVKEQLGQTSGGYFLLQFNRIPPDQKTQAKLTENDIALLDYVPESAYYAYLPPESLSVLEELVQAGIIRYVGPIPDDAKLQSGLRERIQANPQHRLEIIVQFFEALPEPKQTELETFMEVSAYSFGPVNFAEGTAIAADIEKILSLPFVKWVEEQSINQLGNN